MINNFRYGKNNEVLLNKGYMEAYIPEFYFDRKISAEFGGTVKIFALFNYKIGDTSDTDLTKSNLEIFNIPSIVETCPYEIENKEIALNPNSKPEKYRVLKYHNDSVVLKSNEIIRDVANVEIFIEALNSAKLPPSMAYEDIFNSYVKCLSINNVDLGLPAVTIACKISEICRVTNDLNKPYRKIAGNTMDQHSYTALNLRNVAKMSSTFAAVTFEDINSMIISSSNTARYNKEESISPVEKIIKY